MDASDPNSGETFQAIAVTPSCDLYYITGDGIYLNASEEQNVPGIPIELLSTDPSSNIYAATRDGDIYKPTDNGANWSSPPVTLPSTDMLFAMEGIDANIILPGVCPQVSSGAKTGEPISRRATTACQESTIALSMP